jgi:hypothetical protein
MLFVMLGVHAFFGVSLMSSGTLLAPNYWHAIGQTNDAALLADQQLGGAIAWGIRRHPVAAAGRRAGVRLVARRPAPGSASWTGRPNGTMTLSFAATTSGSPP